MHRTPTEELRIVSAYLNTAEESFNQATAHLAGIQGQQVTHTLLTKFQNVLRHLQLQFSDLEQQFQALIPPAGRNDQPGP
jgi:hypothetical protein